MGVRLGLLAGRRLCLLAINVLHEFVDAPEGCTFDSD